MYDDCEMYYSIHYVSKAAKAYLDAWESKKCAANNFAKAIGWATSGGDPFLFAKAIVEVRKLK